MPMHEGPKVVGCRAISTVIRVRWSVCSTLLLWANLSSPSAASPVATPLARPRLLEREAVLEELVAVREWETGIIDPMLTQSLYDNMYIGLSNDWPS